MVEIETEVEFQYGGRLFCQSESSHISAVNEICRRNLDYGQILTFWRQWQQQIRHRK